MALPAPGRLSRILCVVEGRPLLETNRLFRLSPCSPEELGLLLEMTAFLEVLPYRELRPLSESGCWKMKARTQRKNIGNTANEKLQNFVILELQMKQTCTHTIVTIQIFL